MAFYCVKHMFLRTNFSCIHSLGGFCLPNRYVASIPNTDAAITTLLCGKICIKIAKLTFLCLILV